MPSRRAPFRCNATPRGVFRTIGLCAAALAGLAPLSAPAALVNRWSFNNSVGTAPAGTALTDSVSGAVATVRGNNATFSGTSLTLGSATTTGNQTAAAIAGYVDLPNGLISSKKNLTVEVWATPLSAKSYMRVFDFGRVNTAGVGGGAAGEITGTTTTAPGTTNTTGVADNLFLSFCVGTSLNQQRMEAIFDGGGTMTRNTTLSTTAGTQYHYVLTFEDGIGPYGSSGGQVTWYRNGAVVATGPVGFHLSDIEDVNNWLGRSQWSADQTTNASYNEFRIYDHAFTPAEVIASRDAGPTALPAALPAASPVTPPQPVNRWSFNNASGSAAAGTTFVDSIGGVLATLRGQGASFTGSALLLPGTTNGNQTASAISAYVDLPNGIVSSKPNFSVEIWASPVSGQTDQRLFDIGRTTVTAGAGAATGEIIDGASAPGSFSGYDNLVLSLNVGATFGNNRLEGQIGGAATLIADANLSAITVPATRYHYVLTVQDGAGTSGASGSLAKWYRDGVLQNVLNLNFHLSQLSDVNNWLGRSQYSADFNSNVSFDEVRLYNRTLSPAEIAYSLAQGTEAPFGPAVLQPDTATILPGQKVRIPVLANDTGSINSATVEIVQAPSAGTATVNSDGTILYTHDGVAPGPITFTYRVIGGAGLTSPQTVTITVSSSLRIANPALAMPAAPPPTFMQLVDALPGVTFDEPLCLANPPGDTKRLFVCERMAKIQTVPDVTAASPAKQLFLDIQQVVAGRTPVETIEGGANNEHGLLGLAFHPNYATNGYFYAAYTVRISGGSYYQRISRFKVSAANPNQADPASELILLQQLDEGPNHDGGDLHFGPDGYLYYVAGDEENPNDLRLNSQKVDKDFFSGIFRLDVDKRAGNLEPNPHDAIPTDGGVARFSVPVDNPFVHTSRGGTWNGTLNGVAVADLSKVRMEFWALGLRHTWRFSFDSLTGDLWGGDVGQDTYEEINFIVKGGNYGWVYREGAHDTNFTNPVPPAKPAGFTSIDPVYEYVHASVAGGNAQFKGNSVCGGLVYRGSRFPALYGAYIFCDSVSGHVWKRDPATGTVTRITGVAGVYGGLTAMGSDPSNQDVLFCDYVNSRILRLTSGTVTSTFPATLSATGLFADLSDLSPNPGLLPYEPNVTFWSDHAIKRRWFAIPDGGSQMTWAKDANWTFPTGGVWVKHFDLELERGNPATKKRIETRVLVKTATGAYGVSYRWNEAQTEATLVPDEGSEFDLNITDGGVPLVQHWQIPGRTSCLTCHTPQAGHVLSFNTRQLNRAGIINGFSGNQLTLLRNAGYLANDPGSPNLLPRHFRTDETSQPVESRVRSYLAVNCSYCHQTGGTVADAHWDGRPQLTLAETGLINGTVTNNHGNPANLLIVPGDTTHSVVLNRIATANGFTRMPPLATSQLDQAGIALLTEWITSALPVREGYDAWRLAEFGSATSPEGAPDADADGDGLTNRGEFLAGTHPLDPRSYLLTQPSLDGASIQVRFYLPANRTFRVETSTDLNTWAPWDVPGNDGQPRAAGVLTLTGPLDGPRRFFRLVLTES